MELHYGQINTLATDASGVIRSPGQKVVFIPHALPGEEIGYSVDSETARYHRGRLKEIIRPSSDRTAPNCAYYGICGGCQLQHLSLHAHLLQKRSWFLESCARIGRLDSRAMDSLTASLQCMSLQPWHYRQRARFHLSAKTKGTTSRVFGFASDSQSDDGERPPRSVRQSGTQHKITSIENCKVLLPALENSIDILRSALNSPGIPDGELQVELTRCHGPWNKSEQPPSAHHLSSGQSEEYLALSIFHGGRKRLNLHESIRSKCIRELADRGLPMVLPEQGDILKIFPGTPQGVPVSAASISPFAIHRLGFIQPHFQSPSLYRNFVETAARSITGGRMEAWDLYGGSGLFAQALTSNHLQEELEDQDEQSALPKIKVTIVESSVPAIQAAKLFFAAQSSRTQASIDVMPRSVDDFLTEELKLPKKRLPRIIVADPPRSGLEKTVIEKLSKLARRAGSSGAPLDFILVSCDPAAAARDIAALFQIGFQIKNCLLVDAFAQTRHYECLTHLHY